MPFIVKRFRKPCLVMTEDRPGPNGAFEYLDRHSRWSVDPKAARVFTQKGHAKNALLSAAKGWRRRDFVQIGSEVMIQSVGFVAQGTPEQWIVA